MASVCGGCLALQDAGVLLKCTIAGIAMGLVLDTFFCTEEFGGDGTPLTLSDITGSEDASGDMDIKIVGSEDVIKAFQLDIKLGGISLPVLKACSSPSTEWTEVYYWYDSIDSQLLYLCDLLLLIVA